jgi:hypothetical protein
MIAAAIRRYFSETADDVRRLEAAHAAMSDLASMSSAYAHHADRVVFSGGGDADVCRPRLRSDIRAFVHRHGGAAAGSSSILGARAVARVLQGIASPAFQALGWRESGEWGRYRDEDFGRLMAVAAEELAALHASEA